MDGERCYICTPQWPLPATGFRLGTAQSCTPCAEPCARRLTHEHHEQDQDTLDRLLAQDTEQVRQGAWWQWLALGAMATALLCATVAVIGWVSRPDVHALVKLVHVTSDGVAEDRGTVAMAQYTPADWQWIGMLRQWVLALRWRGLDVRQTHLSWDWLKAHTCGEAVDQLVPLL